MKKLIVIPARGGSKGIPGKNIYPVNGKPLIAYTLDLLKTIKFEDTDIVVSTDSEEIKNVAKVYKNIIVINRPDSISGDSASTESALLHALDVMAEQYNKQYDSVITLQATSPLREKKTLLRFIQNYESNYPIYDAQLSLNEDRTDFWIKRDDGRFERLQKNAPRRRQERVPLYVENSAYYITEVNALRKTKSVLGTSANGYIISDIEAVDINEPIDILIAEHLLKQYNKRGDIQ